MELILCVILSVVVVIGIAIKERTNVLKALAEFFCEWWKVIVILAPVIIIAFIIAFMLDAI